MSICRSKLPKCDRSYKLPLRSHLSIFFFGPQPVLTTKTSELSTQSEDYGLNDDSYCQTWRCNGEGGKGEVGARMGLGRKLI